MSGIIGVSPDMKTGNIPKLPYTTITYSGYGLYSFTKTGSHIFHNPVGRHYQILLIGGGGAGGGMGWAGSNGGAGGGAGGFLFYDFQYIEKGDYRIHVGAGGVSRNDQSAGSGNENHHLNNCSAGGTTSFEGLYRAARGGGTGGGFANANSQAGGHGGSGGGGGNDSGAYGSGLADEGYNGGSATYGTDGFAGGGGGAKEIGQVAGVGGDGITEGETVFDHGWPRGNCTFPSNFQNGAGNLAYCGGGGSGRWTNNGANGGAGGGGNGGTQGNHGSDGTNERGGGGGGGSAESGALNRKGGNGGSGLILMRWQT